MRIQRKALLALGLVLLIGLAVAFLLKKNAGADRPIPQQGQRSEAEPSPSVASHHMNASPSASSPLFSRIQAVLEKLKSGDAETVLDALREELLKVDRAAAIAAIIQFLATGRDAITGAEFLPGEGALDAAPTLRVLLMDVLGQLSRQAGSGDAASVARAVLQTRSSADEWAISLRNVAWHEPAATRFLGDKFREMLSDEAWRQNPSSGMLEAFDVAVFVGDPQIVPELADLLGGEEESLQRAAAVALDRLSEAAPLAVMNHLNENPGILADRPFVRADYYAKSDLAQPEQRQAVERYLSRPGVTLAEKTKFLRAAVAPGSFVSDNLLTTSMPPEDNGARRQALAAATAEWIKSGRFPELQPQLVALNARLSLR